MLHRLCLHRHWAFWFGLASEDNIFYFVTISERVLYLLIHLARGFLYFADTANSNAANIPGRLVEVPLLIPPSRPIRSFVLAGSDMMAGGGGMMGGGIMGGGAMGRGMMGGGFSIDGRRFDAARIDTSVNLDTVEDWEYVNTSSMDHPMHLHINPFQILNSDGRPDSGWHDMVNVPSRDRVRIRVAFKDFVGITVQHCHILTHEDAGMMATV